MMENLLDIYKERKQMYLKLFAEGKSWEEARQIVDKQDFDERIEKICPSIKKKVLILTKSYYEHPEDYPKYDNYDAINVNRLEDIPYDYEGVMGVPITYAYYHNKPIIYQIKPNSSLFSLKLTQFKIIDAREITRIEKLKNKSTYLIKDADSVINGKPTYARICIRKLF